MMSKCSFIALYIFSSLLFRDDNYDTSFVVPDEEYVCFHCLEIYLYTTALAVRMSLTTVQRS